MVLAEDFEAGVGVQLTEVFVGDGQHTAGSASRVTQRLDNALLGEDVAVRLEEQIDH